MRETEILIFGENSYIGNAFAVYAAGFRARGPGIRKISSRRGAYEAADFAGADCVLYCAGIAHQRADDALHYSVNRDLAVLTVEKAKKAGARQFVYLSSAAVLRPDSAYGQSKLQAETELKKLEDGDFTVTIIRPPMVYGPGCKGNFARLVRLARATPVFPDIENRRSMIYIENLCHFLAEVIERQLSGTFFPQNAEPVCTTELVRLIARLTGRNIRFTRLFNPVIGAFMGVPAISKLFGNFVYESEGFELVEWVDFEESVRRSVEN